MDKPIYGKRKTEFAGPGCMVQGVGVIALFFFPIGTIAGVLLFILGSAMSQKVRCSECSMPVGKRAPKCLNCGALFK